MGRNYYWNNDVVESLLLEFKQTKSEAIYELLYESYFTPLILGVIKTKGFFLKGERDTLVSENQHQLYKAALTYEPSKGKSFGYFTRVVYLNCLKQCLREVKDKEHTSYIDPTFTDNCYNTKEYTPIQTDPYWRTEVVLKIRDTEAYESYQNVGEAFITYIWNTEQPTSSDFKKTDYYKANRTVSYAFLKELSNAQGM